MTLEEFRRQVAFVERLYDLLGDGSVLSYNSSGIRLEREQFERVAVGRKVITGVVSDWIKASCLIEGMEIWCVWEMMTPEKPVEISIPGERIEFSAEAAEAWEGNHVRPQR